MSRLPTKLRRSWEKAIANGTVPPAHAAEMQRALDADEATYRRRLREAAPDHADEHVAMIDAFLAVNLNCAF